MVIGVEFWTASEFNPPVSRTALVFLSFVDPTRIPLHAATASSFRVQTSCTESREWLSEALSVGSIVHPGADDDHSAHPECETGQTESSIAVLFGVAQEQLPCVGSERHRVTEVMLYASPDRPCRSSRLPTPPTSSPGRHDDGGNLYRETQIRQVYPDRPQFCALALSSDLLYKPSLYKHPNLVTGQAYFISSFEHLGGSSSPHKRDRLGSIFEEASDRSKKSRRRAGQSISLLASKSSGAPSSRWSTIDSQESRRDEPQQDQASFGAIQKSWSSEQICPASSKVSSTVSSQHETLEARNKQCVSRIVMAGMRIHDLQKTKRTSILNKLGNDKREAMSTIEEIAGEENESEIEFKSVYHHAYKSTIFAFVCATPSSEFKSWLLILIFSRGGSLERLYSSRTMFVKSLTVFLRCFALSRGDC